MPHESLVGHLCGPPSPLPLLPLTFPAHNVTLVQAPIDDNTKTLVLAAVALLASAGLVGAGRAAVSSFNERMREGATNLVTLAGFWLVIFFAARAVLEL